MILKRILAWISSLIFILVIWLLWPRELDGFQFGQAGAATVPDYAMTNARYSSVKNGALEMESFTSDAVYDMKKQVLVGKDARFHLYNAAGEKTVVTGDLGTFFTEARKLHLEGNVNSTSPDGFVMRGPEAFYHMNTRFFEAPQPVEGEARQNSLKIWGDKAHSNLDEQKLHLEGNARIEFKDPRHGLTKVRGDIALVDRAVESVDFSHHVRVNQGKIEATSNFGKVFYNRPEKAVRYMALTENVKIREDSGRYTRSQVAEFFAPTDTIVLTGFPSVYDGDDAVTGDKITLYRATSVVEVTATNAAGASERDKAAKPEKELPLTEEDQELIP